jgi:hypothetical protein
MKDVSLFPWETQDPDHFCSGFRIASGTFSINLAYAIYGASVLLVASLKNGNTEPVVWKRIWVPKENAVAAANHMAADVEHYLTDLLSLVPRPTENLDLEDFVEHLGMRLNNELH